MPTVHNGTQVVYDAPAPTPPPMPLPLPATPTLAGPPAPTDAAPHLPAHLWVTSTELCDAGGHYEVLRGEVRNGWPVWQAAGGCYLYCNVGGGWMIALNRADMDLDRGCITSAVPCEGRAPHEHSLWEGADGAGGWREVSSVAISAVPPRYPATMSVVSRRYPHAAGVYAAVRESAHNNYPVWEHLDHPGRLFLFSGRNGFWFIGGAEHLDADDGVLSSSHRHGGCAPTAIDVWDAKDPLTAAWAPDPSCSVCAHTTPDAAVAPATGLLQLPPPVSATRSRPILTPSTVAVVGGAVPAVRVVGRPCRSVSPPPPQAAPAPRLPRDTEPVFQRASAAVSPSPPPDVGSAWTNGDAGRSPARPPVSAARLQQQVEELTTQLELVEGRASEMEQHLRSDIARLQGELADERAGKVVLQAQHDTLEAAVLKQKSALLDSQAEVDRLRQSHTGNTRRLHDDHAAAVQALRDKHAADMEEQRREFSAAMDKALNTAAQNETLQAALLETTVRAETLQRELEEQASAAATLEKKCSGLEDEVTSRISMLEREAAVADELRGQVKGLGSTLAGERQTLEEERLRRRDSERHISDLTALCQRSEAKREAVELMLTQEKEQRRHETLLAQRAAEQTVKTAADSLLQLVHDCDDNSGSESMSPPRDTPA